MNQAWDPLEGPPKVDRAWVRDVEVRPGASVRLWPQRRADILDMALAGRISALR